MKNNNDTYYWQLCSHDEFTREDAEEFTKLKNPKHHVQGFKSEPNKVLEGYYTTTWTSRPDDEEDL